MFVLFMYFNNRFVFDNNIVYVNLFWDSWSFVRLILQNSYFFFANSFFFSPKFSKILLFFCHWEVGSSGYECICLHPRRNSIHCKIWIFSEINIESEYLYDFWLFNYIFRVCETKKIYWLIKILVKCGFYIFYSTFHSN